MCGYAAQLLNTILTAEALSTLAFKFRSVQNEQKSVHERMQTEAKHLHQFASV